MDTIDELEKKYNNIIGIVEKPSVNNNCGCDVELVHNDFYLVCPICGVVNTEFYQFDQYSAFKIDKSYKRIYHLQEQLSNIQALIPVEISLDLKQQIITLSKNKPEKLKNTLRKLKLKKYYEKIPYITWYIWKIEPPRISYNLYKQIISLYKKIEDVYFKLELNRQRFLLINFVIYKCLLNLNRPDIARAIEKKSFKDIDQIWGQIKKILHLKY